MKIEKSIRTTKTIVTVCGFALVMPNCYAESPKQIHTQDAASAKPSTNKVSTTVSIIRTTVPRTVVEEALRNYTDLLKQAYVVPASETDERSGLRIFRIQSGSVYERIGIKNDDVLVHVNGELADNPMIVIGMFNHVAEDGNVSLELVREGRELKVEVTGE